MPLVSIVTANSEAEPLRLAEEVRDIGEALGYGTNFNIVHEPEIAASDLIDHLLRHRPDIVHFAGHGADAGDNVLSVRKPGGGRSVLTSGNLRKLFENIPHQPKLVVLNACYSDEVGKALAEVVPVVIGMGGAIPDSVARRFTRRFYEAIGHSCSVHQAVELTKCEFAASDLADDLIRVQARGDEVRAIRFYAHPELMAKFVLDEMGRPKCHKENFAIDLWLRGVDQNIESVSFEICHDSFALKERFWQISRSESTTFWTDGIRARGDFNIRATAWATGRGIGVESSVSNALRRHYEQPEKRIARAIQQLESR